MERKRYRTARVHVSWAGEAKVTYGSTVRFNLLVPRSLKEAVDEQAGARGLSGPELARRFLAEGIERVRVEQLWARAAQVAPRVRDRDLALLKKMERIADSWERRK